MSIPTIDLSKASVPSTRQPLLQEVRHALVEVGFLYLSNHGIEESVTQDLVSMLPALFALPDDVKESVALDRSPHFLGYSRFGAETTANVQDQREQFELANELDDEFSLARGLPLYTRLQGPNQWLESGAVPRLRAVVESYIAAVQEVALRFLEVVAEALGLPADHLVPFLGPQDRLKLVHYRPSSAPVAESQGVGPHKDSSGWMTFLLQASDPSIQGLQALSKDGVWLDVPPVPGTLVVNMGQAFEAVTNGVCKATTHRVLLPAGDYDRYSVPFFQGVRPDLTKQDLKVLWEHFAGPQWNTKTESDEGRQIDSPFLRGKYNTWGEAQLRTKIRSHRDVGRRHYPQVFEQYVNDH
jgi:isopenicillin N synthase-like dioxygenase